MPLYFGGTIGLRPAGAVAVSGLTGRPNAKKTDENIVRVTAIGATRGGLEGA